jgi:hypothetical protein
MGIDQLADDGNLRREILGRRLAARLVVFEEPVAEGLSPRVEDHDDVVGLLLPDDLAQHVDEAIRRVGGRAVRGAQVRNGKEGAVEGIRSVHEEDARRGSRVARSHAPEDTEGG